MNPTVTTEPAEEPVEVAEAKAQLRVDFDDDDTLIESHIVLATRALERRCNRWFVQREAVWALDRFPWGRELILPGGVLQSVESVKYYDTASVEATFSSGSYQVRTKREPGAVVLADGASWPSTTLRPAEGVLVAYTAGYGAAADVPQEIKHAILLYLTHVHRHRGDADVPIPQAVDDLLWPYRMVPCRKLAS